jgi:hypothetical protein
MAEHVKILGVLHVVYGILGVLAGIIVLLIFGGLAGLVSVADRSGDALIAVPILGGIGAFVFILLLALSRPGIIAGFGLLKLRPLGAHVDDHSFRAGADERTGWHGLRDLWPVGAAVSGRRKVVRADLNYEIRRRARLSLRRFIGFPDGATQHHANQTEAGQEQGGRFRCGRHADIVKEYFASCSALA